MGSGILDPWGLWKSGQRLNIPHLDFPLWFFSHHQSQTEQRCPQKLHLRLFLLVTYFGEAVGPEEELSLRRWGI